MQEVEHTVLANWHNPHLYNHIGATIYFHKIKHRAKNRGDQQKEKEKYIHLFPEKENQVLHWVIWTIHNVKSLNCFTLFLFNSKGHKARRRSVLTASTNRTEPLICCLGRFLISRLTAGRPEYIQRNYTSENILHNPLLLPLNLSPEKFLPLAKVGTLAAKQRAWTTPSEVSCMLWYVCLWLHINQHSIAHQEVSISGKCFRRNYRHTYSPFAQTMCAFWFRTPGSFVSSFIYKASCTFAGEK